MVNYVNTVLVGTGAGVASTVAGATKGQYVIVDEKGAVVTTAAAAKAAEAIKVGMATGKSISYKNPSDGTIATTKEIKWSNIIKKADIKSYHVAKHEDDTEDTVTINFAQAVTAASDKDVRIVVRLTFKDIPARYRKWSESYEVLVAAGSTAQTIVNAFVNEINVKNKNRARVVASNSSNTLVITAMAYDDDNMVDSISPAEKVRFTANAWYTIPSAEGFLSKNKHTAATISKVCGKYFTASAKLVRDAEAQGMGYDGILNRGEGTYPIIKPAMNVNLDSKYDAITLEFENMYRAADDIQRKTKQCLQVFDVTGSATEGVYALGTSTNALKTILDAFVQGEHASTYVGLGTSDAID